MQKKNGTQQNTDTESIVVPRTHLKLIIGLGNPGSEYEHTYHNVGHFAVDYLLKKVESPVAIEKTNVFMNESGRFVARALARAHIRPEHLLILHDESDLLLGSFKFSFGRGGAGHKGVASVIAALGTKNFWRFRIGIHPPSSLSKQRLQAGTFVLKKITPVAQKLIEEALKNALPKIAEI